MQQAYGYLEAMRRACGPHAAVTKPSAHSSSSSSPVPTASPHTRWYALCFQVKQHVLGSLHALLPSPPIVPVVSCGASRAAAHPSRTPSPTSPSRFPPQTDPHDARAGGRPLSPGRPRLRVIPEEDVAAMGEPRKMDQGGVEEEPHTTDKNDTAAYPSRAPHSCRIPMETGGANEGGGDDRFSLKEVTVLLALYARVESEDGFLLRQLMHEVYRLAERKRQWMGHLAVPPVSEVDGCASSTAVGQADADEERDVSGTTMSVSSLLECSESGSTKTKRGGVGGGCILGTAAESLFLLTELKAAEESLLQVLIGDDLSLRQASLPEEDDTKKDSSSPSLVADGASLEKAEGPPPLSEDTEASHQEESEKVAVKSLLQLELPHYDVLQVVLATVALHRLGLQHHPMCMALVKQFQRLQWSRRSAVGRFAFWMAKLRQQQSTRNRRSDGVSHDPHRRSGPSSVSRWEDEKEEISLRPLPFLDMSPMRSTLSPLAICDIQQQEALLNTAILRENHHASGLPPRGVVPDALQFDISVFPLLVEFVDALALSPFRSSRCMQCVGDLLAVNVVRCLMEAQALAAYGAEEMPSSPIEKKNGVENSVASSSHSSRCTPHHPSLWPLLPPLRSPSVLACPTSSGPPFVSVQELANLLSHVLWTVVQRTEQMELPQPLLATALQVVLQLTSKGILVDGGEDSPGTGVESSRLAFYDHVTADLIKINRAS